MANATQVEARDGPRHYGSKAPSRGDEIVKREILVRSEQKQTKQGITMSVGGIFFSSNNSD